jgi:hypothetical protein
MRIVDLENITTVLLPDGYWHDIQNGSFKAEGYINAEGGQCDSSKGFLAKEGATWIDAETGEGFACPMSSIGGVTYIRRTNDIFEV